MIEVINDRETCRMLWKNVRDERTSPFDSWELRDALARVSHTDPFFIYDGSTGCSLPLGRRNGKLWFYGGPWYAEANDFLDSGEIMQATASRQAILERLGSELETFRLLSWLTDPINTLPLKYSNWDVPFNQSWELPEYSSFSAYKAAQSSKRQSEIRYIERHLFSNISDLDLMNWEYALSCFEKLANETAKTFIVRNIYSVYSDKKYRESIRVLLEYFRNRLELKLFLHTINGEDVGMGVLLVESSLSRATYLCNLYKYIEGRPYNKLSHAILLNMVRYATDRGWRLDGMRGAFGLKPRFGFLPIPRYALVRDKDWCVGRDTDLSYTELRALYGRDFQAMIA